MSIKERKEGLISKLTSPLSERSIAHMKVTISGAVEHWELDLIEASIKLGKIYSLKGRLDDVSVLRRY